MILNFNVSRPLHTEIDFKKPHRNIRIIVFKHLLYGMHLCLIYVVGRFDTGKKCEWRLFHYFADSVYRNTKTRQ